MFLLWRIESPYSWQTQHNLEVWSYLKGLMDKEKGKVLHAKEWGSTTSNKGWFCELDRIVLGLPSLLDRKSLIVSFHCSMSIVSWEIFLVFFAHVDTSSPRCNNNNNKTRYGVWWNNFYHSETYFMSQIINSSMWKEKNKKLAAVLFSSLLPLLLAWYFIEFLHLKKSMLVWSCFLA